METYYHERELPFNDREAAQIAADGVTRILIGSMDGAGKSTLSCSLYLHLAGRGTDVSLHEIDPWSDTHDPILGRKSWSQRQKRTNVSLELYGQYVDRFASDTSQIVLGDMQGRAQNPYNQLLSGVADYGILVSREQTVKDQTVLYPQYEYDWERLYADTLRTPVAARVRSVLPNQIAPPGCLPIDGLERQPAPDHPQIARLGAMVLELAHNTELTNAESRAR